MSEATGKAPAVSVVVPIYNVDRYLANCLDSLLAQTLADIEIIGVDDGSTDGSGEILDAYAAAHARIRAIHQENGGLGPARNTGIAAARGRYIGFVDSDDWVCEDMYEGMYGAAADAEADIVAEGCGIWTDGVMAARCAHPFAGTELVGRDAIGECRRLFYGRAPHDDETIPYPVSVWSQLYRKDTIENINARFHEILSEDVFFNLDVYKAAEKVVFLDGCGYCYRKDMQESITRTFSPRKAQRHADFFELLASYAKAEADPDDALMRARRKMVDYSRSFVFMVEKSGMPMDSKVEAVRAFTGCDAFGEYCRDFPVDVLPRYQAMFHSLLVGGRFRTVLALTRVRMILRGEK